MSRTATSETPFSMTYGIEAIVSTEIGEPSFRMANYDLVTNDEGLALNLDLIEIKRDKARLRMIANQQATAQSYNSRVKIQRFEAGDLVMRKVMQKKGVFSPNWEGPFRVVEPILSGSYKLEELNGTLLPHVWNADKLKKYYQ